jgi:hypothetical protein
MKSQSQSAKSAVIKCDIWWRTEEDRCFAGLEGIGNLVFLLPERERLISFEHDFANASDKAVSNLTTCDLLIKRIMNEVRTWPF